jgi:hypothetical protein
VRYKIMVPMMFAISLTACFSQKPFQPHPPTFTQWVKEGISEEGVKESMRRCGYIDLYGYGGDRNSSMNEEAKRENCMFKNGFRYKDGDPGLCALKSYKDVPACKSNSQ